MIETTRQEPHVASTRPEMAGAAHVIERAERVARSLHFAVEDAARAADVAPALR